jgi:lysozyme
MIRVPVSGPVAKFIDLSRWQTSVNFQTVKKTDIAGVILKISQGVGELDTMKDSRWAAARQAGLKLGGYHYFNPSADAVAQAKHFWGSIPEYQPGDILALDVEVMNGEFTDTVCSGIVKFMDEVERQSGGALPFIYSGPYFLQSLGVRPEFLKYPLWVSHYGPAMEQGPLVPPPWTKWAMWQYTDSGSVPGIGGPCDVSLMLM